MSLYTMRFFFGVSLQTVHFFPDGFRSAGKRTSKDKKRHFQSIKSKFAFGILEASKCAQREDQTTRYGFFDNAIRIQKARELLSDPSLKIGEIGELVGYADTTHFARTFKKLENMSANEYRNNLKR